jgi:hypothetical protein
MTARTLEQLRGDGETDISVSNKLIFTVANHPERTAEERTIKTMMIQDLAEELFLLQPHLKTCPWVPNRGDESAV